MELEQALFHEEFGKYLGVVAPGAPVGVCERCLLLRIRSEMEHHPQETCPALLLQDAASKAPHQWKGFTERGELETYIKAHFADYRQLAQQAADAFSEE